MSKLTSVVFVTKWVRRYAYATMTYGFGRAVTYDYKSSREYFNHKTYDFERKPPLVIDTISSTISHAFAAPFMWPTMLTEDLARLECVVRGRDSAEYGLKKK